MNKLLCIFCAFSFIHFAAHCQQTAKFADSIRKAYSIPELNYAVVSTDSILELQALGIKKAGTMRPADIHDLFRIGSNTKAITGVIATLMVKQGKIGWDTRFFDLFPSMKGSCNPAYYPVTLLDLLTFHTRLPRYTYTNKKPTRRQITGNEAEQRFQFVSWILKQKPARDSISFSNPGFVMAGMMLEKASGKTYPELVAQLGDEIGTHFYFGQPNNLDTLQPWGHNNRLEPEAPADNYKLNWLLPAGNITVDLPGYIRFIQMQLMAYTGNATSLSAADYHFLHHCRTPFAAGWFADTDEYNHTYSINTSNPGTFLTNVYVFGEQHISIIIFCNAQTTETAEGMNILFHKLNETYNH